VEEFACEKFFQIVIHITNLLDVVEYATYYFSGAPEILGIS